MTPTTEMLAIILCIVGIILSIYLYFVEIRLKKNHAYKPYCNISDKISCTAPIKSPYGALLFGIPNSIVGMIFYVAVIGLIIAHQYPLALLLVIAANAMTPILAYILYAKIRALCLVCLLIYVVNALLLICLL